MFYTGIGSRRTPAPILATMTTIARYLAERGWTLRSGGATGADMAFEGGSRDANGGREIYRPGGVSFINGVFRRIPLHIQVEAIDIAARLHPDWNNVPLHKREPLARNPFQVSGAALDTPSDFVVYWAPETNGNVWGGTRTAVMYARELGVPTFNLLHGTDALKQFLWGMSHTPAVPDEDAPAPRRAASTDVAG